MNAHIEQLSPSAAVSMGDDWFAIADADHFWMQWRLEAFAAHLRRHLPSAPRVLEIGCGNCIFRDQLEETLDVPVDACDLNAYALSLAKQGRGRVMTYNIFDGHASLLGAYDVVALMDVIEHIDDDAEFLRVAGRHVRAGGLVLVNVPAYEFLTSAYDVAAGHKRRYSKHTLAVSFQRAGIQPVTMRYWGASMVALALARRLYLGRSAGPNTIMKGFEPPGPVTHAVLKAIKTAEIALPFPVPMGTSLMALGRVAGTSRSKRLVDR